MTVFYHVLIGRGKLELHQLQVFHCGGGKEIRVISQIAGGWEKVAFALRFDGAALTAIDRDSFHCCFLLYMCRNVDTRAQYIRLCPYTNQIFGNFRLFPYTPPIARERNNTKRGGRVCIKVPRAHHSSDVG